MVLMFDNPCASAIRMLQMAYDAHSTIHYDKTRTITPFESNVESLLAYAIVTASSMLDVGDKVKNRDLENGVRTVITSHFRISAGLDNRSTSLLTEKTMEVYRALEISVTLSSLGKINKVEFRGDLIYVHT